MDGYINTMVTSVNNCVLSFYLELETFFFILVLFFWHLHFHGYFLFIKTIMIRLSSLNQKIIRNGTKLSDGRFLLYLIYVFLWSEGVCCILSYCRKIFNLLTYQHHFFSQQVSLEWTLPALSFLPELLD